MVKCKYCGRVMLPGYERCDVCNVAWQDGYRAGWQKHASQLDDVLDELKKLTRTDDGG